MKNQFPVYDICTLSGAKSDDVMVSRFAPYLVAHHNLSLPHKHNFYHLIMFTKGGGTHAIDFQTFIVSPFQIYFMIPGQAHSWNFEGDVDGYVVNFSVAFFEGFLLKHDYLEQFPFFNGIPNQSVINLSADKHDIIKNIFEGLLLEYECTAIGATDMIRTLLLQLFIQIARLSGGPSVTGVASYNHTLLKNFRKLVETNFQTLKLPKDYAELLYITPNHLNAVCNSMLGLSAGEVIRNRVILEAKRLLINFDLTVTQIAQQLNFNDNSYFTKFFKKQEQVTPDEFRNNIKLSNHENRSKRG